MKLTAFLLNALLLANSGGLAQTPQVIDKAFLASLRTEASRKHPATSAANLRLAAAGGDVRSVHLWDDPMVGLAFEAGDQETRESDGDIHAGFEQDLPKPGLFAAKLTKAEALKRARTRNPEAHHSKSAQRPPVPQSNSLSPMNRSNSKQLKSNGSSPWRRTHGKWRSTQTRMPSTHYAWKAN